MDKVKELLGVLDLDADHRFWAIQKHLSPEDAQLYDTQEISLADLAFRLRDEVVNSSNLWPEIWNEALRLVARKYKKTQKDEWFVDSAQPIHWIIAALIAKELLTEN